MNLIQLNPKVSISKEDYDLLTEMILEGSKRLKPDKPYDLKTICGDEHWGQFDRRFKTVAGMCAVHMVENGVLPFKQHPGKHEYPKLYLINT
jgi:hypothetical protein